MTKDRPISEIAHATLATPTPCTIPAQVQQSYSDENLKEIVSRAESVVNKWVYPHATSRSSCVVIALIPTSIKRIDQMPL